LDTLNWEFAPHHVAYRTTRENVTRLLTEYPLGADLPVDCCPGWTVRDAVAHLLGICRSVAGLPADGPEKGAAAGEDITRLLDSWAVVGATVERRLEAGAKGRNGVLVMDAVTHELDIAQATGAPPPSEHPSYPTAFRVVTGGLSASIQAHGLPALLLTTPGAQWEVGAGRPVATVGAPLHDLMRSLTGRRSQEQISRLAWSQDPAPWLHAFRWGPFSPPAWPVE
jgi:uncharacterized protein (TIGR03083 family)